MPVRLPFRPRRDAYPPDLWTKCPGCGEMLFNKQLDKAQRVCPHCGHHFRVSARARIDMLVDGGSFQEQDAELQPLDPLGFVDTKPYPDRLTAAQLATGLQDAAVWGFATLAGRRIAICCLDFFFMGGSMGSVVGEKVARATEAATAERVPLVIVSASGGARMQEGTLSLMQLSKTMAAIERLRAAGVPFISVLADPTTGGVFASFAAVGDVNIAEPNAIIRFAGDRVSSGTIGEELPPGYQRAEFWFSHGFIDRIVTRDRLREEIVAILGFLVPREGQPQPEPAAPPSRGALSFLSALTGVKPAEPNGNGTDKANGTAKAVGTANAGTRPKAGKAPNAGAAPKAGTAATAGDSAKAGAQDGGANSAAADPAGMEAAGTDSAATAGRGPQTAGTGPQAVRQEGTSDAVTGTGREARRG